MAVPKYDKFMPAIIRCLGDGKIHTLKELTEYCANEFMLSASDRAETISSGQNKLHNRVGWAKSYLNKAGLIESPKRANFCLTQEGYKALNNGADCVTLDYLTQFDSFNEFQGRTNSKNNSEELSLPLRNQGQVFHHHED